MFLPKDIKCEICSRIFCCRNCRQRHQRLEHMEIINTNRFNPDCPICNGLGAFVLHKVNIDSEKLLEHIVNQHLPMQCKKCFRMFERKSNFFEENTVQCRISDSSSAKFKSSDSPGILLKTIPEIEINNKLLNQNSDSLVGNINHKVSVDSAFYLRNVSSIMKIDQSADSSADHTKSPGEKIVRTTSTPLQDLNSKHMPDSSSEGNVMMISSINHQTPVTHSSIGNESNNLHNPNNSSSFVMKKPTVPNNQRNKILMATTPLRHVLSKSIQRAIQEHGIRNVNQMREHSNRSLSDSSITHVGALDLRTISVLRRSETKCTPLKNRLTETSQTAGFISTKSASLQEISSEIKISSTNIPIELTSEYETCKPNTGNNFDSMMTPKNQVGILKKAISFAAPVYENTPVMENSKSSTDSDSDIWFTPSTVLPRSKSCSILDNARKEIDAYDDVFIDETTKPIKKKIGIWSLVTKTVMRIKSLGSASLTNQNFEAKKEPSPPEYDINLENHDPPYIKRRKISHHTHINSNTVSTIELKEPRRRKIHCRPAISRMQK